MTGMAALFLAAGHCNVLRRERSQEAIDMKIPSETAFALLTMAARKSVETPLGWSHPDCVVLVEAARLLKGEPDAVPTTLDRLIGVLGTNTAYATPEHN
jgi:hypothetical protein